MNTERKRDIFTAFLFMVLGIIMVFIVIPNGIAVPDSVKQVALSPAFWPRIITVGAIISALILLLECMLMRRPAQGCANEPDAEAEYRLGGILGTVKTAILIIALFVFYFSLTTLGIVVASMILTGALMLFFGERHFWLIAALSIGTPLLLYGFFRYAANVPIPLGLFGN